MIPRTFKVDMPRSTWRKVWQTVRLHRQGKIQPQSIDDCTIDQMLVAAHCWNMRRVWSQERRPTLTARLLARRGYITNFGKHYEGVFKS